MSEQTHKAPCNGGLDQVIKNQIPQDMHMTELKPFYPDRPADCDRPLCLSQKHQSNWLLAIKRATGVTRRPSRCTVITYLLVLTCVNAIHNSLWPADPVLQQAYIGPGAGIALVGSFLAVSMAIISAVGAMMIWPIRRLWRAIRGRRAVAKAQAKRVVIVGLDGLEPTLVDEYLEQGLLPNLAKLRNTGTYSRLGTTYPPLSPVAWSSFSTGTNPGKHNIFDFLNRNLSDYKPEISSVQMREPTRKLNIGKYVIPLSRPQITPLRKSKPFWNVLGEAGVFSAILRVPITFPPDKFQGVQLSAMCVPDLYGSQGTFLYFIETGEEGSTTDGDVGGQRVRIKRRGDTIHGEIPGPPNPLRNDGKPIMCPFRITVGKDGSAIMHLGKDRIDLPVNGFSNWANLSFHAMTGVNLHGVCRFYLKQLESPFEMYCTPIQIDPARPVMPISHPSVYSTYLSKLQGTFATLGLAEDTWSLSEGLMNEDAFLKQAYDIHDERSRMLFDSLDRVRRGAVVCVFDAPDRIQHMFWRFIDKGHPALVNKQNTHPDAMRQMYVKMDQTVGQVMERLDDDTALFVMSDHGFKPFRRGVDLNAWLAANGYLKLKNNATASNRTYLSDVDWSATKAYAIGLAGIFINQKDRESQGIVPEGQPVNELIAELQQKLTGLTDPESGDIAIHEAVPSKKVYRGPYGNAGPDLVIGYNVGYRVSWDAAVGKTGEHVFSDNLKAWSGDHCIHPDLVPGVLFSNRKINADNPNIIDMAPTTLALLGVSKPAYMDGQSLLCDEPALPAVA